MGVHRHIYINSDFYKKKTFKVKVRNFKKNSIQSSRIVPFVASKRCKAGLHELKVVKNFDYNIFLKIS